MSLRSTIQTWSRSGRGALLVLALVVLAGCGRETGTVSGVVKYRGKPLPGGTISLLSDDQHTVATSPVHADGTYSIATIPVGEVKIAVVTSAPSPKHMAMPGMDGSTQEGKYVPIPVRYHDSTKSGLTYSVTRGAQTYDVNLQ